jgi:hypothetical protein
VTRLAAAKARDRKSPRGTIGSRIRASTTTKATSVAAPPTRGTSVRTDERPPALGASRSAHTIAPSPMVARSAPRTSMCLAALASRVSATRRVASSTVATPSGTLKKNSQRQDAYAMTQPPRMGPTAAAMAVAADHVPIAAARVPRGYAAPMSARLPGTSSAAPTPCTARPMMSPVAEGARPHAADASAKRTTPATKTRRRPSRSPSAPPTRTSEASSSA